MYSHLISWYWFQQCIISYNFLRFRANKPRPHQKKRHITYVPRVFRYAICFQIHQSVEKLKCLLGIYNDNVLAQSLKTPLPTMTKTTGKLFDSSRNRYIIILCKRIEARTKNSLGFQSDFFGPLINTYKQDSYITLSPLSLSLPLSQQSCFNEHINFRTQQQRVRIGLDYLFGSALKFNSWSLQQQGILWRERKIFLYESSK